MNTTSKAILPLACELSSWIHLRSVASIAVLGLLAATTFGGGAGSPVAGAKPQRKGTLVPPTQGLGAVTSDQVRDALDIAAADVVSIDFGTSAVAGLDVFDAAVGGFPSENASYFVMSTGNTSSALLPNTDPDTTTELGGLNNSEGNDMVQTVLVLHPPPGATCVAFDFAFYSEEFPEYVGSEYNDAFIAEIDQSNFQIVNHQVIAPNNFAFDAVGNVISVNTTFGANAENAAGTTYDGATPFLTAVSPLEDPSQDVMITLSILDLGDSLYDSTVLVDNVRWFFGLTCVAGADTDSDGDALLDAWETNGIDFQNDGTVDLDLPAMGADPLHKDIFVEIDYMVLGGSNGHSHKPKADALQIVIDAFANAPLANPDGTTGIRLHMDAGADTIMNPVTNATWGTRTRSDALDHVATLGTLTAKVYDWNEFDFVKGVGAPGRFSIERGDVFHYCIFAHDLAPELIGISGISRGLPASDFLVTLGNWDGRVGTTNQQAGTLMHELGHNLSLKHGGDDHLHFKPNYLSVMNYFFQTSGLRLDGGDGHFDFSRFLLPSLDENALDETVGLSGVAGTAGYGTRYRGNGADRITDDINAAIDWNFDLDGGGDTSVAVDVNNSGNFTGLGTSDNWPDVVFDGGAVGHLGELITLPSTSEADELDQQTDALIPTDFKVSIGGPGEVTVQACDPMTYSYVISNRGRFADVYAIDVAKVQTWADTSAIPASLALASGASATFLVPVLVPQGTLNGVADLLLIAVTSTANPRMRDSVETLTTAFSIDSDGDGLTDACDECPHSDLLPTIRIDGCDTWVPNRLFVEGCTMSDLIDACRASSVNQGAFVSCVAHLTNSWKLQGLISGQQAGAIRSCAALSSY